MNDQAPRRAGYLYYQAVSFALLLVMAGFSIAGLWGVVGLAFPSLTIESYSFKSLRTRTQYLDENYVKKNGLYYRKTEGDTATGISIDDATERWRDARDEALANERRNAGREVVLWLVAIAVCLPPYLMHRRVVEAAARAEGVLR